MPDGYAVQAAWTEMRLAGGDSIAGYKLAFSNPRVREQLGVTEAVVGVLYRSCSCAAVEEVAKVPVGDLILPMSEGELLFRLKRRLEGPGVTRAQVLEATGDIALAVEVPDTRAGTWKLTPPDVSADNACAGRYAFGEFSSEWLEKDLANVEVTVLRNGELASRGITADVMGHPAESVAFVANHLARTDLALEEGQVILTGSVGLAFNVHAGDTLRVEADGSSLTVELR